MFPDWIKNEISKPTKAAEFIKKSELSKGAGAGFSIGLKMKLVNSRGGYNVKNRDN